MAQLVKNLSAMQETWVGSLDREDPLEKGIATHSSSLAWRIPWTEELGRLYSPWDRKESDTTVRLTFAFSSVVYTVNPQVPIHPTTSPFPSWCSYVYSIYLWSLFLFFLYVWGDCWSFLSCAVFMMAHGLFVTLTSPVAGFRLSI